MELCKDTLALVSRLSANLLSCRTDAAHKAVDKVNKGMDNVMKQQQQAYESASNKQEVKEQGQEALESAKDLAVQTKCASAR